MKIVFADYMILANYEMACTFAIASSATYWPLNQTNTRIFQFRSDPIESASTETARTSLTQAVLVNDPLKHEAVPVMRM